MSKFKAALLSECTDLPAPCAASGSLAKGPICGQRAEDRWEAPLASGRLTRCHRGSQTAALSPPHPVTFIHRGYVGPLTHQKVDSVEIRFLEQASQLRLRLSHFCILVGGAGAPSWQHDGHHGLSVSFSTQKAAREMSGRDQGSLSWCPHPICLPPRPRSTIPGSTTLPSWRRGKKDGVWKPSQQKAQI